jgi:hypothetical protein
MKKILIFFLFALFAGTLFAQSQIYVQSFCKLDSDMTARFEAPKIDGDKIVGYEKPKVIDISSKEIVKCYSTEYYKYKKRKSLWLVSAFVSGAAGTVSYLQAKSASDQYKTATTNAEDVYKKMELCNMISPIALGVAGFCTVEFILTSGKQAKARKLPIGFYPVPLKNGGGLGLTYNF